MIRTRLLVGSLLALAIGGVLIGDTWLAKNGVPWFPFLFVTLMAAGVLTARELLHLFPAAHRPSQPLVLCGVLLALAANWSPAVRLQFGATPVSPWAMLVVVFSGVLIAAFLLEMRRYNDESGVAVPRLALTLLVVAYLGLLPCFVAQLRWLAKPDVSGLMLALAVFVPKGNDIGAFFTGTFLGRHKMTPVLSPKKTWEGFAGGMLAGVAVAVGVSFLAPQNQPLFHRGVWKRSCSGWWSAWSVYWATWPNRSSSATATRRTPRTTSPASAACSTWSIPSSSPPQSRTSGSVGINRRDRKERGEKLDSQSPASRNVVSSLRPLRSPR